MATDNQLRARLKASQDEYISSLADEMDSRADAERKVIDKGLEALGFIDRPTEAHELLLWHVHRIGLVLGFAGLVMVGYGVFGPRTFSLVGYGVTLGGFLLVAVESLLDWHADSLGDSG